MAIVYQSGSVYSDAASGQLTPSRAKVAYILFNPGANNDSVTLNDGTSGSDPVKLVIAGDVAKRLVFIDMSAKPLLFNSGIYCSAMSIGSHLTLVLTSEGASA